MQKTTKGWVILGLAVALGPAACVAGSDVDDVNADSQAMSAQRRHVERPACSTGTTAPTASASTAPTTFASTTAAPTSSTPPPASTGVTATPSTMKCCAGINTNNYCPKDEKDKDGNAVQYTRYNGYWIDTEGKACKDIDGYGYEVSKADGGTADKCGDYEEWNHEGDGCTSKCNYHSMCPGQ